MIVNKYLTQVEIKEIESEGYKLQSRFINVKDWVFEYKFKPIKK